MNYRDNSLGKKLIKNYRNIFDINDPNHKRISSNNIILSKKINTEPNIESNSVITIKPLQNKLYKSIFTSLRNNDDHLNNTDEYFVTNYSNLNKDSFLNINNKYNINKYVSNPRNEIKNIKVNKKLIVNRTKTSNNFKSNIYKKINNFDNRNKYNRICKIEKEASINKTTNKNDSYKWDSKNSESNSIILNDKKKIITKGKLCKNIKEIDVLNDINLNSINRNFYKSEINLTEGNIINRISPNNNNSNSYIKTDHYYTVIKEKENMNNNKYKFVNKNNIKINLNNNKYYQSSFNSKNDIYKNPIISNIQMSYNNKDMDEIKRINSTGKTNMYDLSDNNNDIYNKKNKFVTLSEEKVHNQKMQIQKFEKIKNNYNNIKKNNIKNINNNNLVYNNDNVNLELKETIEKLKNELNEKNKIINNYTRIISDYKGTISTLIAKNKKLGDNSAKLIKQIEQYQEEIMLLKKENSILINNNINYNYNCNEENIKKIKNLKEEIEKYKIANNNLQSLVIKNKIYDGFNQNNKIDLYSNQQEFNGIENKKYQRSRRKSIASNKHFKEDM